MNKVDYAIKYAKQGFYVLPMHNKQPLIKFANHPPLTTKEIDGYWSKYPEANIALRTVDFFVVDIDTKNGHHSDGMQNAKKLVEQGVLLPTLEQTTASGGRQLFYKKPSHTEIKQVIGLKPGIDIKAHINNYVVVPPSTTPKGVYSWVDKNKRMQEPSEQLIDLIQASKPKSAKSFSLPFYHIEQSLNKKWTGIVLDNLVNETQVGQRNDHLTRLCGQMFYAGADPSTIHELLMVANDHCEPPLSMNEVNSIFNSILEREVNQREPNNN